jgi:hypothetical protein
MSFHDFLTWFDGWSENIEGQPTPKQWTRLCEKVSSIRSSQPLPAAPQVQVSDTPPSSGDVADFEAGIPRRERPAKIAKKVDPGIQWRARFAATLVEIGYDHESVSEMMPASFDPASDAASAARAAHAGTFS